MHGRQRIEYTFHITYFTNHHVSVETQYHIDVNISVNHREERFPFAGQPQKPSHTGSSRQPVMCGVTASSCGR